MTDQLRFTITSMYVYVASRSAVCDFHYIAQFSLATVIIIAVINGIILENYSVNLALSKIVS